MGSVAAVDIAQFGARPRTAAVVTSVVIVYTHTRTFEILAYGGVRHTKSQNLTKYTHTKKTAL